MQLGCQISPRTTEKKGQDEIENSPQHNDLSYLVENACRLSICPGSLPHSGEVKIQSDQANNNGS